MDVIRLRKRIYKRPLFTIKRKIKVNSKYGVVRFITKLIKRIESKSVTRVETKPFRHPERVVKFIQIIRNKIDGEMDQKE